MWATRRHLLGGSPAEAQFGWGLCRLALEAINYVADTLLYAGAALALASALPRDPACVAKT